MFLHKNEYVKWHNAAIYRVEVEKWKAAERTWSDENYKACFKTNTRALYILYKEDCAIQAKMMQLLLHVNKSQLWPRAFY